MNTRWMHRLPSRYLEAASVLPLTRCAQELRMSKCSATITHRNLKHFSTRDDKGSASESARDEPGSSLIASTINKRIRRRSISDVLLERSSPSLTLSGSDSGNREDDSAAVNIKSLHQHNEQQRLSGSSDSIHDTDSLSSEMSSAAVKQPLDNLQANRTHSKLLTLVKSVESKYPHALVLTKVGKFWECYGAAAITLSAKLEIRLVQTRHMAGFPDSQLAKYCHSLLNDHGLTVVLLDEFKDPKTSAITRKVTRVISPGMELEWLTEDSNTASTGRDSRYSDGDSAHHFVLAIFDPTSAGSRGPTITTSGALRSSPKLPSSDEHSIIPTELQDKSSNKPDNLAETITESHELGLAWRDQATGDSFIQRSTLKSLTNDLLRIRPGQVVLPHKYEQLDTPGLQSTALLRILEAIPSPPHRKFTQTPKLSHQNEISLGSASTVEKNAYAMLVKHLETNLIHSMPIALNTPVRVISNQTVEMDAVTLSALEISQHNSSRKQKGSLLSVIRRTKTSAGTRLLSDWIVRPEMDLTLINQRLDAVQALMSDRTLRARIRNILTGTGDLKRLLQLYMVRSRISPSAPSSLSRGLPIAKFIQLQQCLYVSQDLVDILRSSEHVALRNMLLNRRLEVSPVLTSFEAALDSSFASCQQEDGVSQNGEASSNPNAADLVSQKSSSESAIRGPISPFLRKDFRLLPEASPLLCQLHREYATQLEKAVVLEAESYSRAKKPLILGPTNPDGQRHGLPAIDLRFDDKLARPYVRVSNLKLRSSFKDADIQSTGRTAKDFLYAPWTELGLKLYDLQTSIHKEEEDVLANLILQVQTHADHIYEAGSLIQELDVLQSFAQLAEDLNLVRPTIDHSFDLDIVDGRHLTVEESCSSTGQNFQPNTSHLTEAKTAYCITGVNMGGKSTFLRQQALIVIMGQAGCFVPAKRARWGLVDRIFSRIGASDDLTAGKSTFFVEMTETADILSQATRRSLVLADEIGRGTSTGDGVALAAATLDHLLRINQSRTFFATHFSELADMYGYDKLTAKTLPLHFSCIRLMDEGQNMWSFTHQVVPGVERDSHGLRIAKLAGLPSASLEVARTVLDQFRMQQKKTPWQPLKWQAVPAGQ